MSLIQNEGGVSTRMPMKFAALRENGNSFRKGRITLAVARGCGRANRQARAQTSATRALSFAPCCILATQRRVNRVTSSGLRVR